MLIENTRVLIEDRDSLVEQWNLSTSCRTKYILYIFSICLRKKIRIAYGCAFIVRALKRRTHPVPSINPFAIRHFNAPLGLSGNRPKAKTHHRFKENQLEIGFKVSRKSVPKIGEISMLLEIPANARDIALNCLLVNGNKLCFLQDPLC